MAADQEVRMDTHEYKIAYAPEESLGLADPEYHAPEDQQPRQKRIALVAHDHKKLDLLEWAEFNKGLLTQHQLYATGTTGRMLAEALEVSVTTLQSGPLGGDQQIGARIAQGEIDLLIFFWDPLSPQPHDTDVKALLRIAVVWNIPVACDRATADYLISSPLMQEPYERQMPDYTAHTERLPALNPELLLALNS